MAGPKPLVPADVQFIAVHCSASPPSQDLSAADIDRSHRMRGFNSIGYHFVIRRSGEVQQGRPLSQRGAHVENYNHCAVGVCLVGGVDKALKPEANFTPEQLSALELLLEELQEQFPNATIQGHRDFPNVAKACPSFNVSHWLKTGTIKP